MPGTTPDELVYEEAVRTIDRQHARAAELRQNAGALIAAAAITVSLLGPGAPAVTPFGWAAVAAFVAVCTMALTVLWPHRSLSAGADIARMVSNLTTADRGNGTARTDELRRQLLMSMASYQRLNARRLSQLARAFRTGALVLIVQLLATVAARLAGS